MATRTEIRNAVGQRLQQPFFKRFGPVQGTATGGSTTTLIDTNLLLQTDNFWRGQWLYLPTTDFVREISASTQTTKTLTWLEPAGTVTAGTKYEVWSQFTGAEVNLAINEALRDAWPFFFSVEEGHVVVRSGSYREYSLTGLSPTPRYVAAVYLEVDLDSDTGTVTHVVAQNRLKDTGHTFTSADVGKTIRIYAGTSVGDYRTISAYVDANTVEVSTNFTSILATDSQYRIVDETYRGWELMYNYRLDSFSNPTALNIVQDTLGLEGRLFRVHYEAEFPALTTEAAETDCPREYLELATLARLYLLKLSLAPATEVSNWQAMYRSTAEAAQAYAIQHRYRHLASTFTENLSSAGAIKPAEYPY